MPVILPCPSCGVKNRLPGGHLADEGRCGSCKAALPPLSEPIDVDPALFDEIVGAARVPAMVDFWADWCGPCKAAAPHVDEVAKRTAGRVLVLKVDVDRQQALVERFQVRGFPTFLVLKDGREVRRHPGFATAAQMLQWLEEAR